MPSLDGLLIAAAMAFTAPTLTVVRGARRRRMIGADLLRLQVYRSLLDRRERLVDGLPAPARSAA